MTPQVLDFIPDSLEDTDTYIEDSDGHHVTAMKKGRVQIKMCYYNGNTFITKLHNILLAPDIYDRLFSIKKSTYFGHSCLFHKGFCTV